MDAAYTRVIEPRAPILALKKTATSAAWERKFPAPVFMGVNVLPYGRSNGVQWASEKLVLKCDVNKKFEGFYRRDEIFATRSREMYVCISAENVEWANE